MREYKEVILYVSKVKGVKEVSINFLTTKMMLDLEDENLDEIIAGIEAAVKDVDPRVVLKRA